MAATRIGEEVLDYVGAVRQFSRNARLYMVHIAGMDMIHGTWEVLFNLYLLALFTPGHGVDLFGHHVHAIEFVGLRLAVGAVASGVASIPAGLLSDRIGRKASFIVGDGLGALVALQNILTPDPYLLLCTPIVSSVAGGLHHVSETAFMAENSQPRERVHLFSLGRSLSTLVGMVGSLIAATHPQLVAWVGDNLAAYRLATLAGIGLWFLSLIPALMLREQRPAGAGLAGPDGSGSAAAESKRVRIGLGSIRHPALVAKLVATGALSTVGFSAALPFLNVFYHEHLHAEAAEIGTTFAAISVFVALGALLAPFVASRFGKVQGVVAARALSVPFVLALAFSPEGASDMAIGLSLVGLLVATRAVLTTLAAPIAEAFAMEVLDPSERATMVGIEATAASLLRAGASLLGSGWMAGGDFRSPFVLTAGCYLASTALFWLFFRGVERRPEPELRPVGSAV
jgi:MFS family permease